MSALEAIGLVVGILVFVAVILLLILIPLSRRSKRMQGEMEAELGGEDLRSASVRTLGLLSRGKGQTRGNGRLVLTPTELRFRQLVPDRTTVVPLASVVSVGSEKSWLGKWVGGRLLCVRWRTPDGAEDAMAWQVRDLDGWIAAIDAERGAGS